MRIVLKKSKNGQFYFVILSKNSRVLATSETYKRRQGAKRGLISIIKGISEDFSIIDESRLPIEETRHYGKF